MPCRVWASGGYGSHPSLSIVPACMNGSTRSPLSRPGARRTHLRVQSPGTPDGARRPCGALLQPVVGVREGVHSVGGSNEARSPGRADAPMKHHPLSPAPLTSGSTRGTAAGGQFGWGGTPLKGYQGCPKLGSGGSELRRRG